MTAVTSMCLCLRALLGEHIGVLPSDSVPGITGYESCAASNLKSPLNVINDNGKRMLHCSSADVLTEHVPPKRMCTPVYAGAFLSRNWLTSMWFFYCACAPSVFGRRVAYVRSVIFVCLC